MFPGINPKQMEKAMRQMGIQSEKIDAEEVIIKTATKKIVISNPDVTKVKMAGQETFQIAGEISEEEAEEKTSFTQDDVEMVMEQTGSDEKTVMDKLKENNGDIAKTILELKED
ncbi:MAG: nascent polypeptide-associated complex protein [Candidatus Nanoarchaeia archaeon]|nr:nascent polypeptide-associated complex protein [Candidatus Nanoarchaeia archaeon]MDD5239711.1 nascent polypeptide-associated complex protein [Candidatus Nanoarchaeia archaeon]